MLLGSGEHKFRVTSHAHGDLASAFASVTCERSGTVEVLHSGKVVEFVHVSPGGSHSWWSSNPLLVKVREDDEVVIRISEGVVMRVEWPLEVVS